MKHERSPHPHHLRVHQFLALQPGPRLIVLGAVHGNETCGSRAIERLMAELDSGRLRLQCGQVTFVPVTNPLAHQQGQRMGHRNLNRCLRLNESPQDFEDHVANALIPLLARHDVLLDLHSFHTAGEPFAMIGPPNNTGALEPFAQSDQERALAMRLGPRRLVEGWLEVYAHGVQQRLARRPSSPSDPAYGIGTTEAMRQLGGYAITLECGQHDDPDAPQVAYRAILNTLAHLGMLDLPPCPPRRGIELLRLCEVIDKHHADAIPDIEPDFLSDVTHEHDDDVSSFVFRSLSPFDPVKLEVTIEILLGHYAVQLMRYKGVLHVSGSDRRIVLQGVHMMVGTDVGTPWRPNETPETRIVFIGKHLPKDEITQALNLCLV